MRVLIDCTQISKVKAGVGIYALNLIRELIRLDADLDLLLIVQDDDPELFLEGARVEVLKVRADRFRRLPFRFFLEQVCIPWIALCRRMDVVHSLHYSFPLVPMRARKVVTVHDMTSYEIPEVHLRAKIRYFRFFLTASRRGADRIVFVSHSTQRDYLSRFPRNPGTCFVAPLGKTGEFRPDLDQEAVAQIRKKYGLLDPYILYVGMIEPRKNLTRLVEAFAKIAGDFPSHKLVIAGKRGWMCEGLFEVVDRSGLGSRVLFPGFVPEPEKPLLMRGADVFAYPSLYEGFGVPVLEALACGVPTITSNLSSMPEVAGEAAVLVDPGSVDEIAAALSGLLKNADACAELARRAGAQAARFTWRRTAEETLRAYRSCATPWIRQAMTKLVP